MKTRIHFTWCQLLVYRFASLLGLAPFTLKNGNVHPMSYARKVYLLIIAGLGLTLTVLISIHNQWGAISTTPLNKITTTIHVLVVMVNTFSIVSTFAIKSNKLMDVMNQIVSIKEEMRKLGIEDAHERSQRKFYGRIIASNCVVFSMTVAIGLAYNSYNTSTVWKVVFWTRTHVKSLIQHNAILVFVETMICISQLFESLNNNLRGTSQPEDDFLPTQGAQKLPITVVHGEQHISHQTTRSAVSDSEQIHLSVGDVEKMGKLHQKLCNLVTSMTNLLTVFLLVAIVQNFSRLLSQSYSMYTHAFVKSNNIETSKTIASHLQEWWARSVTSVLELVLIADACSSVGRMGNATKTILFQVWNRFYPERMRNEFVKFTVQLMHKSVTVSAFEFFALDYSYLFKIFYTALAYFIIMIQLESSKSKTGA